MKKKLAILLAGTMIASTILAGCGSKRRECNESSSIRRNEWRYYIFGTPFTQEVQAGSDTGNCRSVHER